MEKSTESTEEKMKILSDSRLKTRYHKTFKWLLTELFGVRVLFSDVLIIFDNIQIKYSVYKNVF